MTVSFQKRRCFVNLQHLLLNIALAPAVKVYRIINFFSLFLGAFANQLRKTAVRFVSSVPLSAWKVSSPTGRIFVKSYIGNFLLKSVDTLKCWLKSVKSNRRSRLRLTCVCHTISPLRHMARYGGKKRDECEIHGYDTDETYPTLKTKECRDRLYSLCCQDAEEISPTLKNKIK